MITEFYYPHLGGVTEHVQHLALEFRRRGHSVTVFTSRMKGAHEDDPFVERLGRSVTLPSNGSFARMTVGWGLAAKLQDRFRQGRFDVVHAHGALTPTLGFAAPAAAHRLGIPVVATFHSWFRRSVAYSFFRKPLQRRLDRIAAKIAVSEPAVRALSRYFRAEWEIVPNGVDVATFHPNGRRPADSVPESPRLLFLGRLDPRNGLDTVIDAMPGILERFPDAELVVAGDGPLRALYERRHPSLGARVRFVGRVYEERPSYYGSADLYLCPTNRASFGITLLEAMACGTPIVAADVTGFRELVGDGAEAVLIPPGDPGAWSEAVIDLLEDPARRMAMGRAGFEKAADYSWSGVSERVLRVYEKVAR